MTKARLTEQIKELEKPYNSDFTSFFFDFSNPSFKGMKKSEVLSCFIWEANHSIELLTKGIKGAEKGICKCEKTIKACGNIAMYKAAKESEKKHIQLYKNSIEEKREAINLYKKVIAICNSELA